MRQEPVIGNHDGVAVIAGEERRYVRMHKAVKRGNGQCAMPLDEATTVEEEENWMAIVDDTWTWRDVDIELMSRTWTVSES
jgi:hypothetical protein